MRLRVRAKIQRKALVPAPNPPALVHLVPASPEAWYQRIGGQALERAYGLPKGILKHLIEKESRGDPHARSQRGAKGLFQIMPKAQSGFQGNPLDPIASAKYVVETLRMNLKHFGDIELALAAYNWGRGNVINKGIENAPKETLDFLDFFKSRGIIT